MRGIARVVNLKICHISNACQQNYYIIEKNNNLKYILSMYWTKRTEIRQLFGHLSGYGCLTKYIQSEQELMVLAAAIFDFQYFDNASDLTSKINDMKKKNKKNAKRVALSNVKKLSLENMWNHTFLS